jgi:hypothetical protein
VSGNATAPPGSTETLDGFDVAPVALIEARALQQRVDRKYLLAAHQLETLLARLRQGYCALRAGPNVWARYESIYFDTSNRDLYHAHRCGRRPRYKVRIRHHLDRQLTFLEVKCKEKSGRTVKHRLALACGQDALGPHERTFIEAHAPIPALGLFPRVSVSFRRLTLLGCDHNERLTLDRDLRASTGTGSALLDRIVIAELKQPQCVNHAGAAVILRTLDASSEALSKYCLATILLAPVRANIFKPALRAVQRLST